MAKFVGLITGNIGSGKTDLLKYLMSNKEKFRPFLREGEQFVAIKEFNDPVSLENFYEATNPKRAEQHPHEAMIATEIFEESNLIGRINRHYRAKKDSGIHWFDRGMIEGWKTFVEHSSSRGDLTDEARETYECRLKKGFDQLVKRHQRQWLESLIVWLRIDSQKINVLYERQRKRNTEGEALPRGYLEELNALYESFFAGIDVTYQKYRLKPPEVLTVDASVDFNTDPDYHSRILEQIVDKLTQWDWEKMELKTDEA